MTANQQVDSYPTQHMCPVCGQPLWAKFVGDELWIYCPHGPCPDPRMNDGMKADTLELAFQLLLRKAEHD